MDVAMKKLFLLLVLGISHLNAQDGFDRFDAPSEFSGESAEAAPPPSNFEPAPPMIEPPADDGFGDDFYDDSAYGEDGSPPSAASGKSGNSGGTESNVFGRGGTTSPKKDSQYVQLNPETGYGPEIVESFDFPDTDILELTKHMQKLTGINLILDKDVKGKVSISAPTPITVGDAWKAYLSALSMAGFTLVKTGSFYRILPIRDIRFTPTKIYSGDYTPETENFITKIIPLKHASAKEIESRYRQFNTRYGRIIALEQTNTILIQDTGTNIKRLELLVKSVDAPGFEESLQIIKVKNTSAQEIAKLLDSILQSNQGNARTTSAARFRANTGPGVGPSISRIIAEPRTNSIIAMANQAGKKHLEDLIAKLDVTNVSKGSNRIQVYKLKYGDSESLSKTLTSLISNAQAQQQSSQNNANNNNTLPSRFTRPGGANEIATIFTEDVKITSDKTTNSIVVTASPTDWLTVKDVIAKLDVPRDQVFVEGLILETRVDNNSQLGINYAIPTGTTDLSKSGFNDGKKPGFLDLMTNTAYSMGGLFAGVGFGKKVTFTVPGANGGGNQTYTVSSVNALIRAFASAVNANVVATPQVLVMDNSEGTFKAGEKVPYQGSINNTVSGSQQSVEFQEAQLELIIKPQINKETRFIKLNLQQKIEEFVATDSSSPGGGKQTTKREMKTEIVVKDKDTIAMGGLIRDRDDSTVSKVPLLGDIPVLGWLFKSSTKIKTKSNIIFFLTPRIISPYDTLAAQNTKRILDKRTNHLGKELKTKEIFNEHVSELTDSINKQLQGGNTDEVTELSNPTGQLQKSELETPAFEETEENQVQVQQ
jgi:general secretion pathway protein D